MNIQMPRPSAHQPWDEVRTRLDQNSPFSNMHDTPYYRDAVYDHFSKQEYQRRYRALRDKMHELIVVHSDEELRCVRKAGVLCERAMQAIVARAKPGVPEYELRAAAGGAILDGGGDIDFLIIGSTPMADPAMVFGNPRPSHRKLQRGDIINMELAAGYNGLSAQIGSPITLGTPTDMVRKFWEEITVPGYRKIIAEIKPGNATDNMRLASRFFREHGVQSRPTQVHGIDIVTDKPHVFAERTEADEIDKVLKPGMIIMAEPNPITADGLFGIFLGHTFIVTETAHECVDNFPLEIAVAQG